MFPVLFFFYVLFGLFVGCFVYIDGENGQEQRAVLHLGFALLFAFLWPLIIIFMIHRFWTTGGVIRLKGKEVYRRRPKL